MPIASVEYSSPEHLLGHPTDTRSDVYGLGVVAYELLTCHVPFTLDRERLYTLVVQMLTERPRLPSAVAPQPLSPEIDAIILRALASDPAARYPTPGVFADALAVPAEFTADVLLPLPNLAAAPPAPAEAPAGLDIFPTQHVSPAEAVTPDIASITTAPVAGPVHNSTRRRFLKLCRH
jgi:serine/threonine-protein kinase